MLVSLSSAKPQPQPKAGSREIIIINVVSFFLEVIASLVVTFSLSQSLTQVIYQNPFTCQPHEQNVNNMSATCQKIPRHISAICPTHVSHMSRHKSATCQPHECQPHLIHVSATSQLDVCHMADIRQPHVLNKSAIYQ